MCEIDTDLLNEVIVEILGEDGAMDIWQLYEKREKEGPWSTTT